MLNVILLAKYNNIIRVVSYTPIKLIKIRELNSL